MNLLKSILAAGATPRTLPLSGVVMLLAYAAGIFMASTLGWVLFALGALAWVRIDGKALARQLLGRAKRDLPRLALYSLTPTLALLAYLELAAGHADLVVASALAFHALLVWSLLMGAAYPNSQETRVSRRI